MSGDELLEIHERTRRAFLESDADLVAPYIGDAELAIAGGLMREETRTAWRERFDGLLAATTFERWDDVAPPRYGMSSDGTMAWLVELVEMAGTRDDRPFTTRSARLTVFERSAGGWRRVVNATSEATQRPPM